MVLGIRKFLLAVSVSAFSAYFSSPSAHAAPPSNDTCGGAIEIPAAGPFPYAAATIPDMSEAGSAGDPNSACFGDAPLPSGVWYSFTPAGSGTYVFKTCADDTQTNGGDSAITIYTGGCGAPYRWYNVDLSAEPLEPPYRWYNVDLSAEPLEPS